VRNDYPKLDLMLEQNRQAIRNIRTAFMKWRILQQQERELLDSVQEATFEEKDVPLFVMSVSKA